jgi:hypothetical protein
VRVKRDHHRGPFGGMRALGHLADERLMPAMHSIERADGEARWAAKLKIFE